MKRPLFIFVCECGHVNKVHRHVIISVDKLKFYIHRAAFYNKIVSKCYQEEGRTIVAVKTTARNYSPHTT